GRVLRPALRELDFPLLERYAVAVPDVRVAQLPLDRLKRMDAGRREAPLDLKRYALRGVLGDGWSRSWVHRISSFCAGSRRPSKLSVGPRIVPLRPDRKTRENRSRTPSI